MLRLQSTFVTLSGIGFPVGHVGSFLFMSFVPLLMITQSEYFVTSSMTCATFIPALAEYSFTGYAVPMSRV